MAAYLAGGLDAAEREDLERHATDCTACAQALAEARSWDQALCGLFADARPAPQLEDRMVRTIRSGVRRGSWAIPLRFAAAIAAVLILGAVGTVGSGLIADGSLRFPGATPGEALAFAQSLRERTIECAHVFAFAPVDFDSTGSPRFHGHAGFGYGGGQGPGVGVGAGVGVADEAARRPPPGELTRKLTETAPDYRFGAPTGGQGAGVGPTPEGNKGAATAADKKPAEMNAREAYDRWKAMEKSYGTGATSQEDLRDARKLYEFKQAEADRDKGKQPNQPAPATPPPTESKPAAQESAKPESPQEPPAASRRVIIRSGEIEFEVTSFDEAVATVTRLVGDAKGGFVATVNSEKLPNGKVRGSVVLRLPPERLDAFVLDLRRELGKSGELKGQRIGSQDITKQYTDLESRLRAARAMEERLLRIIKEGKGEIKDLVAAEKELGVWRTKVEELEGELRYYANLVALSTLTVTLYEREIRAPAAVKETERVQMGLEVEDVEAAHRDALAAVAEAKGRVVKAELKQLGAGQFNAVLQFEADPDAAGHLRDRLKQLGTVARLEIDRLRQPEGGTGRPQDGKVERSDTLFVVSLYNLTDRTPRELVQLKLVAADAEAVYREVLARAQKVGRVVTSNLNRQRSDQTSGAVQFDVKSAEADAVLAGLRSLGEVMALETKENPPGPAVTQAKKGILVEVCALAAVPPRETVHLTLVARDVAAGYRTLQEAVARAKGLVLKAQLNEQDRADVSGELDFDARREEEATVRAGLAAAGDVYRRTVTRALDNASVTDGKVRWQVALIGVGAVTPAETVSLDQEVADVEQAAASFSAYVAEARGRTADAQVSHDPSGHVSARLVFDVPLAAAPGLVEKLKSAGKVRAQQTRRSRQAAEGELALARLEVTLGSQDRLVPRDEGLWTQVRKGLATSFVAISWSVVVVVIGLCFVLPWIVVLYAAYLIVRRVRRRSQVA
jgi:hypothetical protein